MLNEIANMYRTLLGSNLVGVYLHGSLAINCFNPKDSDIDILVVVENNIDSECKRSLVKCIIDIEANNLETRIELSVVLEKDVVLGNHPMFFLLHYSAIHKKSYLNNGSLCENSYDPDLIAHLAMINSRGKLICGKRIEELKIKVKDADFLDSVMNDVSYVEDELLSKPQYIVLNLCRTLKYLTDHTHNSKLEGGEWVLGRFNSNFDRVIGILIEKYRGLNVDLGIYEDEIKHVAKHLLKEVHKIVDYSTSRTYGSLNSK